MISPELVIVFAVAVAVLVAIAFLTWRRNRSPAASKPRPSAISPPPTAPPPSPPPQPTDETLLAVLQRLSEQLAPLAEKTAHPRELAELPEFKVVVEAFLRADATLEVLHRYACGANWPLACASLLALCRHPERNSLYDTVLGQLGNIRPWTLYSRSNTSVRLIRGRRWARRSWWRRPGGRRERVEGRTLVNAGGSDSSRAQAFAFPAR